MNNILIVSGPNPFTWSGGIETYILNLSNTLKSEGFKVEIGYFEKYGLQIDELENYYRYAQLIQEKAKKYDLLISNSIYGAFLSKEFPNLLVISHGVFRQLGINCRGKVEESNYLEFYHKYGILENLSYSGRNIVAVSSSVANEVRRYYKPERVFTIRNCVDTDLFSPIITNKHGKVLTGLYIGRADTTKGYDIFSEVFRLTRGYVHWIQCISTGGLGNCELILEAETYSNVPNIQMPDLYNRVDFVLFPSRYEGFGLVSIEALSCGKPVIAFETGIFKALARFLPFLSLGSPQQDKERAILRIIGIINILKDELLRKHVRNYGRLLTLRLFNKELWKMRWLRLLENLI